MTSSPDPHQPHLFTRLADHEKGLNTLEGLILGVGIDRKLNTLEVNEIENWLKSNESVLDKHVYRQITDQLRIAMEDGVLSEEEKQDLLFVCDRFRKPNPFHDLISSDVQKLHGLMHGILADNQISKEEAMLLKRWLFENEHLATTYPYDELVALLTQILRDGVIDSDEEKILKGFFSEFINFGHSKNLSQSELEKLREFYTIKGVCALDPAIMVEGGVFSFTGRSLKGNKMLIQDTIEENGGHYAESIGKNTSYLIVGAGSNTCWACECYGRKVELAVEMRRSGSSILIVHELDFWDAIG